MPTNTEQAVTEGLLDLAARCEKADGPDRELDKLIAYATRTDILPQPYGVALASTINTDPWVLVGTRGVIGSLPFYTASPDAAMTLVPEGAGFKLDRYWIASVEGPVWMAAISTGGVPENPHRVFDAWDCANAALATTAAALRARAAQEASQ